MLLNGTVADNIAFGIDAPLEQVEEAARLAEVHDLIESLPARYATPVGPGSATQLSGGQEQRICLARALCRRPKLLLLDEATSALDPATESAIIRTLERLRAEHGYTILAVSHHPNTALHADLIVVVHKGRIAERGTYTELMQIDAAPAVADAPGSEGGKPRGLFKTLVEQAAS